MASRPDHAGAAERARRHDAEDPLGRFRERFHIPRGPGGDPLVYLCGNSLGLMPKAARAAVEQELADWERLAVDGHFRGATPWYSYHEVFREPAARLVGARAGEVVVMNGLTVNLHLMLATFFRPKGARRKILIEDDAFPSDLYAAQTRLRLDGLDPAGDLLVVAPRAGEETIASGAFEEVLARRGGEIALVLAAGLHYRTGQLFDLGSIAASARRAGCVIGFDLAHVAGNVPISLHDWDVDFAAWCSYKYLNAGPGAPAGCFVHERHGSNPSLERMGGWWGNDPATRFRMGENRVFAPRPGADGWQLSNPPILAMAPLRASLAIFDEAGMEAIRAKSVRISGFLLDLLEPYAGGGKLEVLTPREPGSRGSQVSIRVAGGARPLFHALERRGVVVDVREPDVIRAAPAPLYNTYAEVAAFARILAEEAGAA